MILSKFLTDVRIETAPVPAVLEGAGARGVLWQAAPGRFLLEVPGVARYLVTDGATITIDRMPESCEEVVSRYLHMTPLAALCFQRGLLAFHAACCAPPEPSTQLASHGSAGGAILIAGDSGAGKSTLLAALLQRGWTMLADELTIVQVNAQSQPFALPTIPQIRLWQDSAASLELGDENSQAVTAKEYPCPAEQFADAPIQLRAIYQLSNQHRREIETSELSAGERFETLGTLTYNSHVADALYDRVVYLRNASTVANSVPILRLRRPRNRWSIPDLVGLIESH